MTRFEVLTLLLSVVALLLIPAVALVIRMTILWTRTEDKLGNIAENLKELVADKDRVHAEILGQMRDDRAATDRRLRWLEENVWNRGRRRPNDLPDS